MKRIYRYPITFQKEQEIHINALYENGAYIRPRQQVLKVDTIRGIPSIWCLVDTGACEVKIKLRIYGTGWDIPEDIETRDYLGSFIVEDAEIYHVFIDPNE